MSTGTMGRHSAPARHDIPPRQGPLAGTLTLLRLAARRDRILIPVSAVALTLLSVGSAQATVELYPDAERAVAELGSVLASPSAVALYGPAVTTSLGGLATFKSVLMGAIFTGILAYAVVRRHTRVEEEDGRLELLGAGAVGRQAPLAAAVLLSLAATALVAALSIVGMIGIGLDAAGSVAFGIAWAVAGLFMTGVTAVTAQLTSSARGCAAWSFGVLGVAYAVRVVGDTATSDAGKALSWVSPLGWSSKVAAYGENRSWLLLPALGLMAALVAVAFALLERRDLGAGLLPSRAGRPHGGVTMRSVPGLAWRLARPTVVGWSIGFAVMGLVVGSLMGSVTEMLQDDKVRQMLEALGGSAGTLTDIYLATELTFAAAAAAAAGIAIVLRLGAEERAGRAEPVLATATSRGRMFFSHTAIGLALPVLLMALVGGLSGAVGQAQEPASPGLVDGMAAGVAMVPAAWVCVAIAALLVGLEPRWAPLSWGALALLFLLGEIGPTIRLPQWLVDVSPFAPSRSCRVASGSPGLRPC